MTDSSVVYFYLIPENEAAREIVSMSANDWFRESRPGGKDVFRVAFDHEPKNPGQLISLGSYSRLCDIVLPESYARRQCHFWIHPGTGELLLVDDTDEKTTKVDVTGGSKYRLPKTGLRQRVISIHPTVLLRMQAAHFRLWWCPTTLQSETARTAFNNHQSRPSFAQAALPASPGAYPPSVRPGSLLQHHNLRELGRGSSAVVYLTVDLATGDYLAVKTWRHAIDRRRAGFRAAVGREIQVSMELAHVRNTGATASLQHFTANKNPSHP